MLALDPGEIMRMRSELMGTRVRAEKIIESSRLVVREYRDAVARSRRLLDQSRELRRRAEEQGGQVP